MRLIDADAAITVAKKYYCNGCLANSECQTCDAKRMVDEMKEIPTITAEQKHGRWIDATVPNNNIAKCSLCGFWQKTNGEDKTGKHMIHKAVYRYCAGCGARMDGGAENG